MTPERTHSQQSFDRLTKDAAYGEEEGGDFDLDGDVISFFFCFSVRVWLIALLAMIIRPLGRCKGSVAISDKCISANASHSEGGYS